MLSTRAGLAWVGEPFPGFFLLRNRVITSVSLLGWPVASTPAVFQASVMAVDGHPVTTSAQVYDYVRGLEPGTPVAYTLEEADGSRSIQQITTSRFAWRDALLLFGAYLFNGVVFAASGIPSGCSVGSASPPGRFSARSLLRHL